MEMVPPLDAARRQAEQGDESEQQAVAVRGRQNELATRPQHAAQLPRGEGRIDEVFQDFAAPDQVEGSVRKGQRLVRIDHLTLVVEALHVDRRDDVPASLEPTTLVSFAAPYVERPPPRPGIVTGAIAHKLTNGTANSRKPSDSRHARPCPRPAHTRM